MDSRPIDTPASRIATMDRRAIVKAILMVECDFPVDFSREYLRGLSLQKLRHIYMALCTQTRVGKARRRRPKKA